MGKPLNKALKRLAARIAHYEKAISRPTNSDQYFHKPGSLKAAKK